MRYLLLILVGLSIIACGEKVETSKAILGTWEMEAVDTQERLKVQTTYNIDSSFVKRIESKTSTMQEEPTVMTISGKWWIEDNLLIEMSSSSDAPQRVLPKNTRKFKILSINDKEMRLENPVGASSVLQKIK